MGLLYQSVLLLYYKFDSLLLNLDFLAAKLLNFFRSNQILLKHVEYAGYHADEYVQYGEWINSH